MRKLRVLVVDDDHNMLDYIGQLFPKGYDVQFAQTGARALGLLEDDPPDVMILDLVMAGIDGYAVCERARRVFQGPIIVLSGRSQERDKVRALDLGADDYLTKPFGQDELMARIRAVLRRTQSNGSQPAELLNLPPLQIDFPRRLVRLGGRDVRLTPTEYALLEQLAGHPGRLQTHASLLQHIGGPEYRSEIGYLRVFIRRLRRKIELNPNDPQFILTEARAGYRFRELPPPVEGARP